MKVLLLSAYDAESHRRWRRGLQTQFPAFSWTQLHLPPRYFNWRIRGNSLSWAFSQRELLSQPYDLLIATSMVDLSALRGFVPTLSQVPTLVYFHENQFAYPTSDRQHQSIEPQMVNLYSALCADRLAFNSAYNRDSFIEGVTALLRKLPDQVPDGVVTQLQARACCLPVPLEESCFAERTTTAAERRGGRFELVWNHRWEYDKGPERFYRALQRWLPKAGKVSCHVVGQQFRRLPPVFDDIKALLQAHDALGEWGYIESVDRYRALLSQSQAVVSSALHDFQGLAVMEAVAAGCVPLVPSREAYPEWFGVDACYASHIDQPEHEALALAGALTKTEARWRDGALQTETFQSAMQAMAWPQQREGYRQLFEQLSCRTLA